MKKERLYSLILSILVLINPVLDLYVVRNSNIEVFGVGLFTVIRYLLLLGLIVLLIYKTKLEKLRKTLIVYVGLVIIYCLFHHYTNINFVSLLPDGIQYSFIEEAFYIARFSFPIVIVYYMYAIGFNKDDFKKVICIYSFMVSLSIIFSNITLLSLSSYVDKHITYSIFDWFTHSISYITATTRGFFYSSIVITNLLLLTPYLFYLAFDENSPKYYVLIIMNMLSLFMVGTKACTFGAIIIAVLSLAMSIFFYLYNKKHINLRYVVSVSIIIVFFAALYPFSPAKQRITLTNSILGGYETEDDNEDDTEEEVDTVQKYKEAMETLKQIEDLPDGDDKTARLLSFFEENTNYLGFNHSFMTKYYPYQHDLDYWVDMSLNKSFAEKADNRYMEESLLKRVKEINNDRKDDFFGITYSRTSKIFNLEKDFVYQYYSLGIVGVVLLLGPLALLLGIAIFCILFNKDHFNFENCSLCLGLGLIYFVAYYSGNAIDNLGITITIGFVLGYLINNLFNLNKKGNYE